MKLNFWDIIMLVGVVHAVILGGIILFNKKESTISGKLVSSILFVLALAIFGALIDGITVSDKPIIIQWLEIYFPFLLIMLLGPLIYFLVKSQLTEGFRIDKSDRRHFYPVIFNLLPTLLKVFFWITFFLHIPYFQVETLNSFFEYFNKYADVVFWIHLTTYLILTKKFLNKYNNTSNVKEGNLTLVWLNWFVNLFLGFQILWLPYLIIYISKYDYLIWEYGVDYYFIYIPLVGLIYWLSIKWILVSKEILFSFSEKKLNGTNIVLTDEEIELYSNQLNKLMIEEHFYLKPSINVKDVAHKIGIAPKTLSHFLNHYLNINFNDFINKYRISEVKSKLGDTKYNCYTIAAIAFESGFESIPTFQRAFKNFEQVSPKEYKKSMIK